VGRDCMDRYMANAYTKLKVAKAWRIENPQRMMLYLAAKGTIASNAKERQQSLWNKDAIRSQLRADGASLPGKLDEAVNECFLLHGTTPTILLNLIHDGLNERFAGSSAGTAFGDGCYLADDVGKTDQYSVRDEGYNHSGKYSPGGRGNCAEYDRSMLKTLHKELYPRGASDHPKDVFYVLVCRAALGYMLPTADGTTVMSGTAKGTPVFAMGGKNRRELAPIPESGTEPAHSLKAVCGDGHRVVRFNEYVIMHSNQTYPEYLVAYHRHK